MAHELVVEPNHRPIFSHGSFRKGQKSYEKCSSCGDEDVRITLWLRERFPRIKLCRACITRLENTFKEWRKHEHD